VRSDHRSKFGWRATWLLPSPSCKDARIVSFCDPCRAVCSGVGSSLIAVGIRLTGHNRLKFAPCELLFIPYAPFCHILAVGRPKWLGSKAMGVARRNGNLRSHPTRTFSGMTFDPAVLNAIAGSRCPQCGSLKATPLMTCQPSCPGDAHVHFICDACARRRVEMIGPGAA
jgi:hypothetical protein